MTSVLPIPKTSLSWLALPLAASLLTACGGSSNSDSALQYDVQIKRTSFGIPHITAPNLAGAAYGLAYAYAQDNLCLLADHVLTVSGQRSAVLGPDAPVTMGGTLSNLKSDFVYRYLFNDSAIASTYSGLSADAQQLVTGYVDGYNRYLRDQKTLPPACNAAGMVRPITTGDMYRLLADKATRSSSGNFVAGLYDAAPPSATASRAQRALTPSEAASEFDAAMKTAPQMGSNGYALGKDTTDNNTGMLLGNPHFPWGGIDRFYEVHMTVPGQLDVMGATLGGVPLVGLGFNQDMAWTHTVSTGRRFTLHEMTMQGNNHYLIDGVAKELQKTTVNLQVKLPSGEMQTRSHDFYATSFGPLLSGTGLSWTATKAFALKDVNLANNRMLDQWLSLTRATSVAEVKTSLTAINGLPWVNTLAVDRSSGQALYADVSVTPYVTPDKLAACSTSPIAQAFAASRNYVLDGSSSACDWDTDPATGRQTYPAALMPMVVRSDYVANSNESAWMSNPAELTVPASPIIGLGAKTQSLRTRMGFTLIADRLSNADGKGGNRFNLAKLESNFYDARAYSAELLTAPLLTLCSANGSNSVISTAGNAVDIAPACSVLSKWNKRMNFDAVGVPVFREFWRSAQSIPSLWATPFNAADPVNTPRDANISDPAVAAAMLKALANAVEKLSANGVALDAPLGSVQYVTRGMQKIAIDGGDEFEGTFNKMTPAAGLTFVGYTPIAAGSSYIQAVTFDAKGPVARGILTYSQATDPASPYFADQTVQYSRGAWVKLPFSSADINADPALTATLKLQQ
ncbi:aculeacin A acylase [Polaromonas sp.]|nr:aculeacin A acylase [Polaromonas sp.]